MLNAARQHLLRLAALAALAFAAPAMAEDCFEQEGKCFGVWWMTATPAKVANVNVQARDDKGNTPLHIAAYSNTNPEVVNALIKNGAEVNAKNKEGNTPLHSAAAVWWGLNPEVINALIKSGADSSIKNNNGHTALELGKKGPILYGFYRSEIHQLLKEAAEKQKKKYPATSAAAEDCREQEGKCFGVDWNTATPAEVANVNVHARDDNGRTPLYVAAWRNENPDVFTALLQKGADVNAKNENGATPLYILAWYNKNPEIVNALIQSGANVNAKDKKIGATPLHWAAVNINPNVINYLLLTEETPGFHVALHHKDGSKERAEQINSNIERGMINVKNKDGNTPLPLAEGHKKASEIINALIKNGADVNAWDKKGDTPLHYAMKWNSTPEVINALIKNGADVNAKSIFDNTPLHYAAKWNTTPEIANALIKNGADVNAKNNYGFTPLLLAANEAGRGNTNPEIINALIKNGADVNAKNEDGDTPLFSAITSHKNPKFVNALVDSGADVNAKNEDGDTPLILAAYYENSEAISALVAAGADINATNTNGTTPLMMAASKNENPEVVNALIKNGADVNAKDKKGDTALHYVTRNNKDSEIAFFTTADGITLQEILGAFNKEGAEVVNALIQNGTDVSIKNNAGKTALEVGKENEGFYGSDVYQALKEAADKQKG